MTLAIRLYDLTFALDDWTPDRRNPQAIIERYEAAQGLVLTLLRHVDPETTEALHNRNERKAIAISPVSIQALPGRIGRASLSVGVWQPELVDLLDTAVSSAGDLRTTLAGHPAVLLGMQSSPTFRFADLYDSAADPLVRVRFISPTFFGFGRHPNRMARVQRVPDPGPVVASWLRAWKLTGDHSLDWLPSSPEELALHVELAQMQDVRTRAVMTSSARIVGFTGECGYRWMGTQVEGQEALTMLARFSAVCGTGAKTGRGFGQTRYIEIE